MTSPSSFGLQKLDRLDASLPCFEDQLCDVFYGEEYIQCVPNLEGDDLDWLVNYLDKVCHCVSPQHPPIKPA